MAISSMENPQDPEGANFAVLIVDNGFDGDDDDDCNIHGTTPHSTSSSLSSKSDAFSTPSRPLPLHLDDSLLVAASSSLELLQDSFYNHDVQEYMYNHPRHHHSHAHEDEEHNDDRRARDNKSGYNNNNNNNNGKHESYSSYYPLKRKPSRTVLYLRNRAAHASNVTIVLLFSILLTVLLVHRLFSLYMTHRQWINAPITYMERPCDAPQYETITTSSQSRTSRSLNSRSRSLSSALLVEDDTAAAAAAASSSSSLNNDQDKQKVNICITTLTDAKSTSLFQRFIRWRNFDGILELTWQNKMDYANKHGYHLIDGSDVIDTSRPPAWSKIPAVQRLLQPTPAAPASPASSSASSSSSSSSQPQDENGSTAAAAAAAAAGHLPHCDWVMWTDADTVFMNSQRKIEDFLPIHSTTSPSHDLLVGSDNGGGYNSGVFLLRNTAWSRQFLNDWWNMTTFVRPPGMSLSGDNHALKALLATLGPNNFNDHVLEPSRCTLNAFAKFLTISESLTVMSTNLNEQPWFLSQDYYHKGDFLAHAPGYDNKAECLRLLLQEAR